jgi:site-specific DNA-methyltransferase (adenine-specific)
MEGNVDGSLRNGAAECAITAPATDAAKQWQGWGTALKPACEPICVARKPLEGTVAANVLKHGTGAINVDAGRVGTDELTPRNNSNTETLLKKGFEGKPKTINPSPLGRWPANVLHDGSEEVLAAFEMFGEKTSGKASAEGHKRKDSLGYKSTVNFADRSENAGELYGDTGTAARFFKCCPYSEEDLRFYYTAKASKSDRGGRSNNHPTVKPTDLMRYLVRLICPMGGIVLDPFNGSGATTFAAREEHCRFIGIDVSEDYCAIARKRLAQPLLPLTSD